MVLVRSNTCAIVVETGTLMAGEFSGPAILQVVGGVFADVHVDPLHWSFRAGSLSPERKSFFQFGAALPE